MERQPPNRSRQVEPLLTDKISVDSHQPPSIQVLFTDSALLVVNKPAGLSTLPDGYDPSLPHVKRILEQESGRLWVVHRLDKETSGVLLFARTPQAHRALNTQFEQHQVTKIYHALVVGDPQWQEHVVDLPLRPNGDRRHRTVVDMQAGKLAVTHLTVLERFACYCLLEAQPETGRTHQIRAHLAAVGLSIVSDKLYAGKNLPLFGVCSNLELDNGMGLHARLIEFNHPHTGERIKFTAPYPGEWDRLLHQLRLDPGSH